MKLIYVLLLTLVACYQSNAALPDQIVGQLGITKSFDSAVDQFDDTVTTNLLIPLDGTYYKHLSISTNVNVTLTLSGNGPLVPMAVRCIWVVCQNTNANLITWSVDSGALVWTDFSTSRTNAVYKFCYTDGTTYASEEGSWPGGSNSVFTKRATGDGYVSSAYAWTNASRMTLYGEDPTNAELTFTFYEYGADIFFLHPSNQLEFHSKRGGNPASLVTIVSGSGQTQLQVRDFPDGNSLMLYYPQVGDPGITTEAANQSWKLTANGSGEVYTDKNFSAPTLRVTNAVNVGSVSISGVPGWTGFTTNGLGGFVTNKLYWSGGVVTNVEVISF